MADDKGNQTWQFSNEDGGKSGIEYDADHAVVVEWDRDAEHVYRERTLEFVARTDADEVLLGTWYRQDGPGNVSRIYTDGAPREAAEARVRDQLGERLLAGDALTHVDGERV